MLFGGYIMKIINAGYNYKHSADFKINRPLGSGDYILLVLRTPAFFILNGEEKVTEAGTIILLRKGTPQIYGANQQEFVNDWVHFEAEQSDVEWIEGLGIVFDELIKNEDAHIFSGLIKSIFQEQYSTNAYADETAHFYFRILLLKIAEVFKRNADIKSSLLFRKFSEIRNDIYSNPQRRWDVREIADSLSISISYFQHKYKNFFDTGVKRDIINSRIEYAKHLLFTTDYPIYYIADKCCYENAVHFMRVFKSIVGVTPSMYRKQMTCSEDKIRCSNGRAPFCLANSTR